MKTREVKSLRQQSHTEDAEAKRRLPSPLPLPSPAPGDGRSAAQSEEAEKGAIPPLLGEGKHLKSTENTDLCDVTLDQTLS